jgi:two-component system NtrC family sensor kinase
MALADAVLDLPGLCPAAASLAALALERDPVPALKNDPAAVMFLAQHGLLNSASSQQHEINDSFLLASLEIIDHGRLPFIHWRKPGLERVWRASQSMAAAAQRFAELAGADPLNAFSAGLLAPLGWLGVCALRPDQVLDFLAQMDQRRAAWQAASWGLDHASLTRRLVRSWRLPSWLGDIVGHLDWQTDLVARIGVDEKLVAVTQLAVAAVERAGAGLGLIVGAECESLAAGLHLTEESVNAVVAESTCVAAAPALQCPRTQPLLADVLRLTLNNRQRRERSWIEQLNRDIDRLETALAQQVADECDRLAKLKIDSLAEFAGGAGHEINNPLAVISGQAQYVLKQMQWAEELLLEDPTPAAVLEAMKAKLTKPLQTIVNQSQRIHQVIIDLMQFARPQPPKPVVTPVSKLMAEAIATVRPLAEERRVRIVFPETPAHLAVRVDPGQIRLALTNLLRNGIEAAPQEGWTSLRVQRDDGGDVSFAVDDNGSGLADRQIEHMFDPFFSGRTAGRGRGLGLSTAWRLARLHGGDVRLDRSMQGVTRFLLTLPASDVIDNYVAGPSVKREAVAYQFSGRVG